MNSYIYKYNKYAPITMIKYTSPKKNSYKKKKILTKKPKIQLKMMIIKTKKTHKKKYN